MKSKMWNKIFKNKSSSSKSSKTTTATINETSDIDDNDDIQQNQQQVIIPSCSSSTSSDNHPHNNNNNNINNSIGNNNTIKSSSSSKLSKMVNSFTLKRNSNKENGSNNNNNNFGYNNDVALSIIRNAELNNDITKYNNNNNRNNSNNNNLNKNIKNIKRQKTIDDDNVGGGGNGDIDDFIPIMDTTSKLIIKTPPDEIPLSPKSDFNDPNFSISQEPTEKIELKACPICTRKFKPDTLIKHVDICERMATKKRKKFDSFRQRREGTDLAAYLPKNFGIPTTTTVNKISKQQNSVIEQKVLSPKIQIQESTPVAAHKQFESESQNTQNIKKRSTLNPISPISKPVRSKNVVKRLAPTSEQCPHCERSFGIKAFDRHVDWCKEKTRIQAVKNNADLRTAKDRLEARTKYRAPNLKAKRDTIRNKYSGNGDDGHSIDDNRSVDNNVISMSNSLSSSFMSDGPSDEKPKLTSNSQLSIKAHKINTESTCKDEATINLKNIKKSPQNSKQTNINAINNNKNKKTKTIKKEVIIKKIDNDEDSSIPKDNFNLIGLSLNVANESENPENNDELVSFDNVRNISNVTSISNNIKEISHDDLDDLETVDRIEIEEIIPLKTANFDDTPIKPATKIVLGNNKPVNNFDETPIRPTKTIFCNNPSLVLPTISDANKKVENLENDLELDSVKSIVHEISQNESVENLKYDIPIKKSSVESIICKADLVLPKISTTKFENVEVDLPISSPISNMKKNRFNGIKDKSIISPVETIFSDTDAISNCNVTVRTKTTKNKSIKNTASTSNLPIKSKSNHGLNDNIEIAIKNQPNNKDKLKLNAPIMSNKIIPVPKPFTPIQSPKTIIKNKLIRPIKDVEIRSLEPNIQHSATKIDEIVFETNPTEIINDFNEIPIRSTTKNVKNILKNDIKETSINQKLTEKYKSISNRNDENPNQLFEVTLLKNTSKDVDDEINIRADSIDKTSSNRPINSKRIKAGSEKLTPIRSPKIIIKNNSDNNLDGLENYKMKTILRNPHTKSVNDITNKLQIDILKDKYANNFKEIPNPYKKLNTKSLPLLNITDNKNKELEIRPTRKPSLKTILPPINRPSLASISSDDFDKLLSSSEQINGRKDSQTSFKNSKNFKKDDDQISLPKVISQNSVKTMSSSNDSTENFWMQMSNDTGTRKEQQQLMDLNLNEENFHKKSGFSDKYDPFLSAKRQLEEICSPTAEAESPFLTIQHHPVTSTPITIKPKLTSSLSTSYTAPSPNPRNTLNTVNKTNFRRTSSLRSPRKNNPCPRPLFIPPSRCLRPTTIQRGISDEGPISTNFIRPEEYDEMPVKSACINNFATAINSPQFARRDSSPQKLLSRSTSRESSPLVIKRDPNSNLNRRNLRLNLGNNKELNNNSSNNIPLLKTDSLAVFLKYETELTKNPSDKLITSLNKLNNTPPIVLPQQNLSSTVPPPQSVSNLISEKDWKDKSNNLSKQNSLKNSSSDLVEKTFGNVEKEKLTLLKNSLTNLLDNGNNKVTTDIPKILPPTITGPPDVNIPMPSISKSLSIKLEPLHQNIYKNIISTPPPSKTQSPPIITPSLAPLFPQIKSTPMTVAINNNHINLNSILNIDSKEIDNNNFIDPKLINICDNLQMITTNNTITSKQSDDSDLTSVGSQDSAYRPKTAPNLLIDERRHSSGNQSSESVIEKSPSPPINHQQQQQRKDEYQRQTSSNRNSSDKKNLLKRQIRLGKNQFLYDASPSDSEPSPDPITNKSQDDLNNSITSSTTTTTITHLPLVESSEKQFDSLLSPSNNPIFNDFDFEEFLSSFEASNDDDEQFPGFKDCKEFLMNRCFNMRSMNNNNFINNTQNSIRSRKIELDPMMMLNDNNNRKRQQSHDDDDDDDVQIVHDKREIFISIETDQNDNETSNPCPNDPSIKNPKIEEINCNNDNKFTKIETYHLPIFEEKDENLTTDFINNITIRRNNVKNKQQHDDNITCDSVNSMYPVDSDERSSVECYPIGRRSVKSKTSADSAYGSLSRQSPTLTDRSSVRHNSASRNNNNNNNRLPNEQINIPTTELNILQSNDSLKRRNRELSASSSGSENSLPPINSHHHHNHQHHQQQKTLLSSYQEESNLQNSKDSIHTTSMDFGSLPSPGGQEQQQMSKFCHECGSRFLVSQAKFCMECGVKRIILK